MAWYEDRAGKIPGIEALKIMEAAHVPRLTPEGSGGRALMGRPWGERKQRSHVLHTAWNVGAQGVAWGMSAVGSCRMGSGRNLCRESLTWIGMLDALGVAEVHYLGGLPLTQKSKRSPSRAEGALGITRAKCVW